MNTPTKSSPSIITFNQFILWGIVGIFMILVFGLGVYFYLNGQISILELNHQLQQKQILTLKEKVAELATETNTMVFSDLSEEDLSLLSDMTDELINPLYLNKLDLITSHFSKPEIKEDRLFQKVKLTLSGSFGDIGRYIEKVEQFKYPYQINQFEIKSLDDERGQVQASFEGSFWADLP